MKVAAGIFEALAAKQTTITIDGTDIKARRTALRPLSENWGVAGWRSE